MCVRGLTNHSASRMPKIYSGVSWQIVLLSPFDKCFCVIHWNSLFIGFCQLDIVDIPAVAEGVELAQRVGHGAGGGQRIAPCVIGVCHHLRAAAVDQSGHVALRVLQIEVFRASVGDGHGADLVVGEVQGRAAGGRVNVDLRQRVTEVGVACPRGLACVDDLAAGIAGVIDAAVLADSVSAGVIAETDHFRVAGSIGAGHLLQLAAMLPTVAPCAVIGKITDLLRCFQIGEYEV